MTLNPCFAEEWLKWALLGLLLLSNKVEVTKVKMKDAVEIMRGFPRLSGSLIVLGLTHNLGHAVTGYWALTDE